MGFPLLFYLNYAIFNQLTFMNCAAFATAFGRKNNELNPCTFVQIRFIKHVLRPFIIVEI